VKKIPYHRLYRFADWKDYLLIFFGIIGGIGHGVILPLFSLLFGKLTDVLAEADVNVLFDRIKELTPYFLIAGAAAWVFAYMHTAFFQLTAQRQVTKIRDAYLRAMLR
jgi:ATP-binding cassette subfamily B (MDR/TAP) protein 1